jgi:hypothetical protein
MPVILFVLVTAPFIRLSAQSRGLSVVGSNGIALTSFSNSYALVIGESRYTNGWPALPGVTGDTLAIKRLLEEQGFSVQILENVTSRDLRAGIENFFNRYGYDKDVRLLIYYAGHGQTLKLDNTRDMGYIVPIDAPVPTRDETGFKRLAIAMQQFDTWAKQIESRHVLFMFDSCFSGSIFATSRAAPGIIDYKIANPVRQFIASGGADEMVPDVSIFRRQVEAGLRNREADYNKDGYVSGSELGDFLQSTVVNYTNNSQHPQYGKIRDPNLDKGDFVFEVGRVPAPEVIPAPIMPPQPANAVFGYNGRTIPLPAPLTVKNLGSYEPGRGERIQKIILDSNYTAYAMIYWTNSGWYVRQGGRVFGPFSYVDYDNYYHSGTWSAQNGQGQYFVGSAGTTNGPISDPGIEAVRSVHNLDGRRLAYTADITNNQYILQNGLRREGPYDSLGNLHVAPVTGKIAYEYGDKGKNYLMIDGKTQGPFTYTHIIGWSSDGQKCAYQYTDGNDIMYIIYGGYSSYTSSSWSNSFAPDGKTLVFSEGTTLHLVSDTGFDRRIYARGSIRNWRISNDGRYAAYMYQDAAEQEWVVLVSPDGSQRQRTYGPFQKYTVSFSFSPNPEVFVCSGTEALTGQKVIYANDEKYAVSGDIAYPVPVFTAQEGKYAAFVADIGSSNILYTDSMIVAVDQKMGNTVLPDGTPVYWTRDDNYSIYLNIAYDRYGPFEYAANISDAGTIRWLMCGGGNMQLISIER